MSTIERWDKIKLVFKTSVGIALSTGMLVHVISLFIGRQRLIELVLTPTVDSILTFFITLTAISGIALLSRVQFKNAFHKGFYVFIMFYFSISIPLHVRGILTNDMSYIFKFPDWYSFIIIVVQAVFLVFLLKLKYNKA